MEKILRNKYFRVCVKIMGITIIICSVEMLFINVMYGNVLNVKWLNKKLGSFGEYGAIIICFIMVFTPYMGVLKKKNIQGFKKLKKCIYLQKVSCINWIRYNSCCNYSWCLLFIKGVVIFYSYTVVYFLY